jgi:hypothetical protein
MRIWIAERLRRIAERLDRDGAPKRSAVSFTFERGIGIVTHLDGRGCPLWNLRDADYMRAFTEADDPVRRINWVEMRYYSDYEMDARS